MGIHVKLSKDDIIYPCKRSLRDSGICNHPIQSPFAISAASLSHQGTYLQKSYPCMILVIAHTIPNQHHCPRVHKFHNQNRQQLNLVKSEMLLQLYKACFVFWYIIYFKESITHLKTRYNTFFNTEGKIRIGLGRRAPNSIQIAFLL